MTSPNFPTERQSPIIRTLGGASSGTAFAGFFVLPSATKIKLPMPTMKASSNNTGWSSFDQSFLMGMVGMFYFILDADIWLQVDQPGIILRFRGFPNRVFELVQFEPVSAANPPVAKPLFLQLDIGRMHHQDLFLRILALDQTDHIIQVTDQKFLVRQELFHRHRLGFRDMLRPHLQRIGLRRLRYLGGF